ncbi:hypothetical protein FOQG_18247 [Fusarium oxysporum f. sp. raphani 54005]|uniref:Uncharacterized protein n=1 Tax=Fusarium oxysporum f. sp. raphani 54005 TaxID=1089458 RepID=X0BDX8_FUSOX|nr:hypothetical protein FOQG_18247 [Fusarium oxysporum f. sp. raphani 54005]
MQRGRVFTRGWYDTRYARTLPGRAPMDQFPREGGECPEASHRGTAGTVAYRGPVSTVVQ